MKLQRDEMILFLDCTSSSHKKTRAYAQSVSGHIQEYTFMDYKFTTSLWRDILDMLGMEAKQLLNKADPKYQRDIKGKTFDEEGWLNILVNNPCLIKAPIAIMHNKAVMCITPKDIYKLQPGIDAQF
jgi:arsenate reductase